MAAVETVKVKHPDLKEGVLINKCDFDKEKHELWHEVKEKAPKPVEPRNRAAKANKRG